MAGIFKKVKLKTLALLLSKTSHRRAAGVTPSGVPPVSRPTRPLRGLNPSEGERDCLES